MRFLRAEGGPLLAAASAALVYGWTLAPSVGAGDSGELILAANALGITHPPGYPLWVLFARLAASLPIGDLAWRVNALSALVSAFGAALFFKLCRRAGIRAFASAIAVALYAGSTVLWRSAVEAEVYALGAAFFLLMVLLALRARSAKSAGPRSDALFFFVAGLAILAHQTLFFPAAVLGAWVLARRARAGRVAWAAAWGLLGASLVLVIPVRWGAHPSFFWGGETGWGGLAGILLRRNYGVIRQNPLGDRLLFEELWGMGGLLASALGVGGALLAAAGAFWAGPRRATLRAVAVSAGSVAVALAGVVTFTPDPEHLAQIAPFLAPVLASAALLAGAGVEAIQRRTSGAARRALAGAALVCAVVTVAAHARECDRSGFRLPERYARDLLTSLPLGAVLIVEGDNETFLSAYATRVAGLRPDVTLIHRRGYLFGDRYGLDGLPRARWLERAHQVDLERLATSTQPVYYANPPADLEATGVRFVSAGLISRAVPPRGEPSHGPVAHAWLPPRDWPRSSDLLSGEPRRYDYVTRKLAISYSAAAGQALWEAGRASEALAWYEDAARVGFDFPEAHINLATVAAAVEKPELALDELLAARALVPRDPEPAARLAVFLAAAGRHRDAAVWFERAYRLAPTAALAADAARAWTRAGDSERARFWAERVG